MKSRTQTAVYNGITVSTRIQGTTSPSLHKEAIGHLHERNDV
jgi:hypothetical protein